MFSLLKLGFCLLLLTLYACNTPQETLVSEEPIITTQEETANTTSTVEELTAEQKIDQLIAEVQQKDNNLFTMETFEAECGGGISSMSRAIDKKSNTMRFVSIEHSGEHGGKETQYYFDNNNQLVCIKVLESFFPLTEEQMTQKQIYLNQNTILKASTRIIKGKSVSLEKLEAISWELYTPKKEEYTIETATIQQFKTMDKAGFESYACEY